jgi:hypothetical protein
MALLGLLVGAAPASASPSFTVTGQVISASTSTGISGVAVFLNDSTDSGDAPLFTTTDSNGGYTFANVPASSYFVSTSSAGGYIPNSSTSFLLDADFTVPTLTLTQYGVLSGSVTDYDGTSSIEVYANYFTGGSWSTVGSIGFVQPDGSYSLNAVSAAGEYSITFQVASFSVPYFTTYYGDLTSPPDPSSSSAGVIEATANENLNGLDVGLTEAGFITGTVSSGGSPVDGIDVDAYDNSAGQEYDAVAPTSAVGAYEIKVPANTALQVETDGAPPYEYQTWDGHNGCGCTFDPVTVGPGLTKTDINFALLGSPVEILTLLVGDDGSGTPEPLPGGTVNLYRQVSGGYKLIDSQISDSTGTVEFTEPSGGNLRMRVSYTDLTTHETTWYPMEEYGVFDPTDTSGDPVLTTPPSPVCYVSIPGVPAGGDRIVFLEITPDSSLCGPEPAVKHPATPGSSGGSSAGTVTTPAVSTPTPTPTPTPMPTSSPSPTPNSSPSSTASPVPAPSAPGGGLPWWIWLLIVVGILILIAVGIIIFRVRR